MAIAGESGVDRAGADRDEGADYLAPSFEEFFEAEYRPVLAFARVTSRSWAQAEDLTQDAFLAAHRSWARISRYDRPGAFVRRVVANRSISVLRRLSYEAATLDRLRGAIGPPSEPAMADDQFWDAVRRLPKRRAQVLALHYLEDRSVGEIAVILALAEGTVKAHLFAARRQLAAQLGELAPEEDT